MLRYGREMHLVSPRSYSHSPETVESLFIAYRLTGDELYREQGWKIFQAIEKHCKVETGGYATVINVDQVPAVLEDKMETFFLVCSSASLHKRLGLTTGPERNSEVSIPAFRRF